MIHATAQVDPRAEVDPSAKIWNAVQVREQARIGRNCILGKDAYIDFGVEIGENCKIQNGAKVYHGATVEDGVFIGPQACILNDRNPRAITLDGELQSDADWEVGPVRICRGASIGAGALILPGVTVGEFALVGAGAVVTRDVPPYALVMGNPARPAGYVCACGRRLHELDEKVGARIWVCEQDGIRYMLKAGEDLTVM